MFSIIKDAFQLPDLRQRILYTLICLVVFRVLAHLPAPGLSTTHLPPSVFTWFNLISGGALSQSSIISLGLSPYITAVTLTHTFTPFIPALQELKYEGEVGRHKTHQIHLYLTVPMIWLAAIPILGAANQTCATGFQFFTNNILVLSTAVMSLTGGTMFLYWLSEQITENGIGHGPNLIIVIGVITALPSTFGSLWQQGGSLALIVGGLAFVIIVWLVVRYREAQRRIPVQYGRRIRGRQVYQGQTSYIPLKLWVNPEANIETVTNWLLLIALLTQCATSRIGTFLYTIVTPPSYVYITLLFLMIIGYAYVHINVWLAEKNIPQLLQQQGGFIPGVRPGKKTEEHIREVQHRITFIPTLILAFLVTFPFILERLLGISTLGFIVLSIIIIVGGCIDTLRQLEAQTIMRGYEGFI